MDVLILGNHTQGLGIIRSLAHSGYGVHLASDTYIALSRFSRYLTKYHSLLRHTLSRIYQPEVASLLISFIKHIVPNSKKVAFFCVHEDLVNFVYQHKHELQDHLHIPDNHIDLITDKYQFAQEMTKLGIAHPRTMLLPEFDMSMLGSGTEYLWKGRTGNKLRNRMHNTKGGLISSQEALDDLKDQVQGVIDPQEILIQERLPYNQQVLHCCGLAIEGEIFRLFQYVKLRQHPDEFGTGTFLQSIKNDELLPITQKIVSHFKYTGIFEVEFVQNDQGEYIVIEMNPRTWKSINFATDCQQNMCAAYCDYILKRRIPDKKYTYDVGKYWVDIGTDIPMLMKNKKFPDYWKCRSFCVLSAKDPLPFVMEIFLSPCIKIGL